MRSLNFAGRTQKQIFVGIVGANAKTGWAKASHVPAVKGLPGLKLAAVATSNEQSARDAAEAFGADRWFSDPLAMIHDDEIDVVTIAVKVPAHRELVLAALNAGKAVYCEAPLGRTVAETEEMASAVGSLHTAVGLQGRLNPAVRRAAQLLSSGQIGRPLTARIVSSTTGVGPEMPSTYDYFNKISSMFFPGMMGYLILMLMTPAYNCFAYEGRGIQTYFTAPLRFRNVLLGKNLMHAGVLVFEVVLSMLVLALRIGLPSTPVFIATIAAVIFAVAGQFAIADWVSLSFPRKLEFGSMRGQRSSGVSIWVAFGVQILLAGICSLILFAGRWTNSPWLPAEAFVALAAASIAGYFATLDVLSGVAEKKKEILIETLSR